MVQALARPSDRELSQRFTELTGKKTTLEAELSTHRGQVDKVRERLWLEEEKNAGVGAGVGGVDRAGGKGKR